LLCAIEHYSDGYLNWVAPFYLLLGFLAVSDHWLYGGLHRQPTGMAWCDRIAYPGLLQNDARSACRGIILLSFFGILHIIL